MARSVPEQVMFDLLTEKGYEFEEQQRVAGHKIDFVVVRERRVCLDTNGDHWHSWPKIVACDVVKLDRVLAAGELPLGVWWSRLRRSPEEVVSGLEQTLLFGRLPWWDWNVRVESLRPENGRRVRSLVQAG
jgi:very-short-patch-repair endonuclease